MIESYKGKLPEIEKDCFVADSASVIGDVTVGSKSSIWFGAVIRGDEDRIVIGSETNIQDNAVLHCDTGYPIKIGNNVTIGHGAIVHGCTIGDNALIGMGAIVMNGAQIGENAIVGAGAVCTEKMIIPAGAVAVGIPAKVVKVSEDYNRSMNSLNAAAYTELSAEYLKNSR